MRILGIFLILVLGLATPLAFSESISDVIKNDGKFQFFDQSLLELIDSGEVTEYPVKFFPISNDPGLRDDQINIISSLLVLNYDATKVSTSQNDIRPYVQATIPIENLPLIAKISFVGIITPSNPSFVKDVSASISDQIKNNPKFKGFNENWLYLIDNDKVDVLRVYISTGEQLFTNKIIPSEHVPKLVDTLKTIPGLKDENIFPGSNYVIVNLPVKELLNIARI